MRWEAPPGARLNQFPQFTTVIDGQRIHFLHVRSAERGAFPLVLTHGWPGSVAEFTDVIGPLTNPRQHGGNPADAFDVVIPSLPAFGFSAPLPGAGWGDERTARAWAELMRRLGYDRYGAQGGDWGARISPQLARTDPQHVAGVHVNAAIPGSSGTRTSPVPDPAAPVRPAGSPSRSAGMAAPRARTPRSPARAWRPRWIRARPSSC